MLAVIPLTEEEEAAVDDGQVALDRLLDRLADTPTPSGQIPRQLDVPAHRDAPADRRGPAGQSISSLTTLIPQTLDRLQARKIRRKFAHVCEFRPAVPERHGGSAEPGFSLPGHCPAPQSAMPVRPDCHAPVLGDHARPGVGGSDGAQAAGLGTGPGGGSALTAYLTGSRRRMARACAS